jgi:hypothetical protein
MIYICFTQQETFQDRVEESQLTRPPTAVSRLARVQVLRLQQIMTTITLDNAN